ncbi:esterase/lipase family protein [Noviherbaspirillum saxi]|uniref:Alpha/beta fold hydrolase n=1 Tax=Noviherbaspirillum saxi TaxID=2320863 RepID=A0A3A3FN67_9BURK|nr:alpha/beta fold hydrolase [Noviherbaspirillum saxi]RJF96181.1 alpha/beta fold hydrolase [Noviherbaspirillum saxi]
MNAFETPTYPPLMLALEPYHAMLDFFAGHAWRATPLPRGDGHPVLVYPGLGVSGAATTDLRVRLLRLGYQVYDWEMGVGVWPLMGLDPWLTQLAEHLRKIHAAHRKQVSIVGWSLGGIYARELAKLHPEHVRQVITLGTPFGSSIGMPNEAMNSDTANASIPLPDAELLRRLGEVPPVPSASIYSQTDGVVDWVRCIGPDTSLHQSIEVLGVSHFGMVHHPEVLRVIAEILAKPPIRNMH